MNPYVLDANAKAQLNGLKQPTPVVDEDGLPLGLFLPIEAYKEMLASVPIPYTEEELKRRSEETGGIPLADFWKVVRGPAGS